MDKRGPPHLQLGPLLGLEPTDKQPPSPSVLYPVSSSIVTQVAGGPRQGSQLQGLRLVPWTQGASLRGAGGQSIAFPSADPEGPRKSHPGHRKGLPRLSSWMPTARRASLGTPGPMHSWLPLKALTCALQQGQEQLVLPI